MIRINKYLSYFLVLDLFFFCVLEINSQTLKENFNSNKNNCITVNILDKGAIGDGDFNNHKIIQKVIDSLSYSGGGTILFPSGVYAIYNESLAIWGSNIKLIGEGIDKSFILKKGKVGFFGDCIDICGKINGYQYVGNFGKNKYPKRNIYRGKTTKSENIELKDLTISTDLEEVSTVPNGLGILNSNNIKVINCKIINSPQTNVAIVNETFRFSNGLIKFENCTFENSGKHNVRVISYNQGDIIGNNIEFEKCQFLNVLNADLDFKELKDMRIHLWYRGGVKDGLTSVKVEKCYFDDTGIIFSNVNTNGLIITNSSINSALRIQHSPHYGLNPKLTIRNNILFKNYKYKTPFVEKNFHIQDNIYIYPRIMKNSSKNVIIRGNK